jgi:hypothetical protein
MHFMAAITAKAPQHIHRRKKDVYHKSLWMRIDHVIECPKYTSTVHLLYSLWKIPRMKTANLGVGGAPYGVEALASTSPTEHKVLAISPWRSEAERKARAVRRPCHPGVPQGMPAL